MKKLFKLFCIVILMFTLSACNSDTKQSKNDVPINTDDTNFTDNEKPIETIEENNTDEEENSNTLEIDIEGNLSLPEGYPKQIVPLYKPIKIGLTNRFNISSDTIGYEIQYVSDSDVEDVHNYYVSILKDSQDFYDMSMEPTYSISGYKENYAITLIITPSATDPDKTSVTIGLEEISN